MPARLTYSIVCDTRWRTRRGQVSGWLAGRAVNIRISRTSRGMWKLNGVVVPGLEACVDLDFGFTPATNLLPLRRIGLKEGEAADLPVVWLDVEDGLVSVLPQRYERRSQTSYWYEAPSADYRALLEVCPTGFVRRYPGLWEAES
jgi:uncharacterized protein